MSQQVTNANNIDREFKVAFSKKFLKCPLCPDSGDYDYNGLITHAKHIVMDLKSAGFKDKANHMGLIEYLERDFQTSKQNVKKEIMVCPWMAVVANISIEYENNNGKKLKDDWIEEGYKPIEVHFLLNSLSHSRLAVVEFGKTWDGFYHVMTFIKSFEVNKHGKKDWFDRENCKDDKMYAWVATDEDYNSFGPVGDYLRKNGDLKTVADVQKEDESVILGLRSMIGEMDKRIDEMKSKISKTDVQLETAMKEKEELTENFKRDMEIMEKEAKEHLKTITREHKRAKWRLEDREKGLRARETIIEIEKKKLDDDKRMIELAILEQKKADERLLKLAEDEKREKEKLHHKIIKLQKKLDEKQHLELEIKLMKGAIEMMKHVTEIVLEAKNKLKSIQNDLKEKEEELESLEELNQTLIVRERKTNDELVEARKELINGLRESSSAHIGVKRMGKLDKKPFKRHCSGKEGIKLVSLWENQLGDPSWHPFKVVTVGGESKEIVDEEDEKIASLKNEFDEDVFNAVVTALTELNKYNPSRRYEVRELWNNKEKRYASLKECVEYLIKQWKTYKPNNQS